MFTIYTVWIPKMTNLRSVLVNNNKVGFQEFGARILRIVGKLHSGFPILTGCRKTASSCFFQLQEPMETDVEKPQWFKTYLIQLREGNKKL
jgi:hypothetical protein